MMRLDTLLRLANACQNDPSLLGNHLQNGVLNDLHSQLSETKELIELIGDDGSYPQLEIDLKAIQKAISIYESLREIRQ